MKFICVGRNYPAHAAELKNEVPEEPVIFLKPDTAKISGRPVFYLPDFSDDIHYEVEVVLRISKNGKHIEERFAHKYFDAYTVGIDFTARDLQQRLKSKGLPWERAKAFDLSAPAGKFIAAENLPRPFLFHLEVNGKRVQSGNTADMLFSPEKVIAFASSYFTLLKGDLVFTGTPAGVGKVNRGDRLEAFIGEEKLLKIEVR